MTDKITRHMPEANPPPMARIRQPLTSLRDEVERLFDSVFPATLGRGVFNTDPWRGYAFRAMGDIAPEVDIRELADHYEIAAELPGMDEKNVDVTVKDGVLCIRGEKKQETTEEKGDYHLSERTYGSFMRSFRMPENADLDTVNAEFAKGVLTISVTKRQGSESEKKVDIKVH